MFASRRAAVLSKDTLVNQFAVECAGTNDFVKVNRDSDLDAGTSPFAVSVWFNIDTFDPAVGNENQSIVSKGNFKSAVGNNFGWSLGFTSFLDDKIQFDVHHFTDASNKLKLEATKTIDIDDLEERWVHIAATRTTHDADGTPNPSGVDSRYNVYINGVAGTEAVGDDGGTNDLLAADKAVDDNLDDFRASHSVNDYDGSISDVAYYKGELNADDVMAIYKAGHGIFDHNDWKKSSSLVLWWRMGDGTENGAGSTIYDMSSNSYNGTLYDNAEIVRI